MINEKLHNRYVTKEDVKNLATKDDIKEIIDIIHFFAESIDKRFEKVDREFTTIKSTMVTKDYLDDKIADFRGDMVVLVRKEDTKVKTLVDVLVDKGVLDEKDQKKIYSLEPFAQ